MTNAAASPGGPVPLVLPPVKVSIEADATALTTGLAEATAAVEVLEAAMRRIGIPAADVPTAAQVTATVPTGVQRGIRPGACEGVGEDGRVSLETPESRAVLVAEYEAQRAADQQSRTDKADEAEQADQEYLDNRDAT